MKIRQDVAMLTTGIAASLWLASPALATRNIQIDVASQSNTLTSCGAFAGCQQLSLGALNSGAVGSVNISPTGFIEFVDFGGGYAHFSIAESATTYQVLSGYTLSPSLGRIDFIDFYAQGSSTAVLPSGNRPAPDFQLQFREVNPRGSSTQSNFFNDLEIAFAYNDPFSGGANRVAPGATIGYSGGTLGVQQGTTIPLAFAGFPAQHMITNGGGLLLGQQATDSDFVFVVGGYPDTDFETVVGLVSETFTPRYVATAPVPEPATWGMLVLGFGVLGRALRRRQSRIAAAA